MKLAPRREKILSSVVELYTRSGEPVGSKAIADSYDLGVSSATIRNELKSLDEDGYLEQPHTSAGRIPTRAGYRYYIDFLMQDEPLDERVAQHIERAVRSGRASPESILRNTASVLSELTDMAAVTTSPSAAQSRVHRIRVVSTGRQTSMVVLVTSDGMVQNRLCRCGFVLTPELISMFDKALNDCFAGVKLSEITRGFLQTAASSMGELSLFVPDILISLYEAAQSALEVSVAVSGETNLLFSDAYDFRSARNVLRALSDTGSLCELLNNSRSDAIYLGEESRISALSDSSVIVSRYDISGGNAGAVAVIAPLRIDYKTIFSEVRYAAACVSGAIGELIEQ